MVKVYSIKASKREHISCFACLAYVKSAPFHPFLAGDVPPLRIILVYPLFPIKSAHCPLICPTAPGDRQIYRGDLTHGKTHEIYISRFLIQTNHHGNQVYQVDHPMDFSGPSGNQTWKIHGKSHMKIYMEQPSRELG